MRVANVLEIARGACQHASDGFDAAKAAALDSIHTAGGEGEKLSAQVNAAKKNLLAKADACMTAAKPGLAMAQASIAKAKSAIEMCAAKSPDGAKSIISGLGTDLSKVQDIAKTTGKASQDSILGAIWAGAQHALDSSKSAVARAQDAIAKAKDAAKNAQKPDAHKLLASAADEMKRAEAALAKAIVARFVVLLRNFGNGITERYQKMVTAVVMRSAKQLIGLQQQTLV